MSASSKLAAVVLAGFALAASVAACGGSPDGSVAAGSGSQTASGDSGSGRPASDVYSGETAQSVIDSYEASNRQPVDYEGKTVGWMPFDESASSVEPGEVSTRAVPVYADESGEQVGVWFGLIGFVPNDQYKPGFDVRAEFIGREGEKAQQYLDCQAAMNDAYHANDDEAMAAAMKSCPGTK